MCDISKHKIENTLLKDRTVKNLFDEKHILMASVISLALFSSTCAMSTEAKDQKVKELMEQHDKCIQGCISKYYNTHPMGDKPARHDCSNACHAQYMSLINLLTTEMKILSNEKLKNGNPTPQ
jgi:hypothetical protein